MAYHARSSQRLHNPACKRRNIERIRRSPVAQKFGFPENAVAKLVTELPKRALFINAEPTNEILADPDDTVFYEIVMSAQDKENAYLITGNIKHFPSKPFIVTPREMLDIIQKNKS